MPAPLLKARLGHTLLVTWLLLSFPALAVAGGEKELCPSSRAANALISCQYCMSLKHLMTAATEGTIQVRVHNLQQGAVVEIAGHSPDDVANIQQLVDRLWETSATLAKDPQKLCKGCEERHHQLARAVRDRALTEKGAIVVLTADDPELVTWLREEARSQGELVRRASSE